MVQAPCPALRSVQPVVYCWGSSTGQGDADAYDSSVEDGLTAEVLIVIVGALGRRGG